MYFEVTAVDSIYLHHSRPLKYRTFIILTRERAFIKWDDTKRLAAFPDPAVRRRRIVSVPSFFLIHNTRNHFEHEHNLELDRISNPNDISNSRIISNTNNFEPEQHFEHKKISNSSKTSNSNKFRTRTLFQNEKQLIFQKRTRIPWVTTRAAGGTALYQRKLINGMIGPITFKRYTGDPSLVFPVFSVILFQWHVDDIPKMLPSPWSILNSTMEILLVTAQSQEDDSEIPLTTTTTPPLPVAMPSVWIIIVAANPPVVSHHTIQRQVLQKLRNGQQLLNHPHTASIYHFSASYYK